MSTQSVLGVQLNGNTMAIANLAAQRYTSPIGPSLKIELDRRWPFESRDERAWTRSKERTPPALCTCVLGLRICISKNPRARIQSFELSLSSCRVQEQKSLPPALHDGHSSTPLCGIVLATTRKPSSELQKFKSWSSPHSTQLFLDLQNSWTITCRFVALQETSSFIRSRFPCAADRATSEHVSERWVHQRP